MKVSSVHLSVVTTADAHEGICESFAQSLANFAQSKQLQTELIFVDDLRTLANDIQQYSNAYLMIKTLTPPQHIGQFNAILLGLQQTTGQLILVMDADMIHNIEDISRFRAEIDSGMNVIFGRRIQRLDVIFIRRILSYLFNLFVRYMTKIQIHDVNTPMIMASRLALDTLKTMPIEAASHKAYLYHCFKSTCSEIPITVDTLKKSSNYTFALRIIAFYPSFIEIFKFRQYLKTYKISDKN